VRRLVEGRRRSRLSDFYYYVIFRRIMLAAYARARRLTP